MILQNASLLGGILQLTEFKWLCKSCKKMLQGPHDRIPGRAPVAEFRQAGLPFEKKKKKMIENQLFIIIFA